MLELIESKILTVWGRKKSKTKGKKDERFKVKVGIRLIYNDGKRVVNPENGVEEIGKGTQAFFSFIYGTMNWTPAQRYKTDRLNRPLVDNFTIEVKGEKVQQRGIIWEKAELGSKDTRGMKPEKFAQQSGFAQRVMRDMQAFIDAQESLAEEELAEAA